MRPDANVGTCRLARARLGQPAARFAHMPTLTHDDDVLIPIKGGENLATTPDAAQISWPPLFRFGGRRRAAFVTASVQVRLTVDTQEPVSEPLVGKVGVQTVVRRRRDHPVHASIAEQCPQASGS